MVLVFSDKDVMLLVVAVRAMAARPGNYREEVVAREWKRR
jgi:hypothetical protein